MGIALDSSALIDLQRGGSRLLEAIPEASPEVFIPVLVLAELWIGIELASSAKIRKQRLKEVQTLLDGTTVLPFAEEVAPLYARLFAALRRKGTPIPSNDLAIAAIALHHGHDLLVGRNDEAHFRKVPGLGIRVI